ncbi:MAG: ABC transporter substrate-binding protein [Burkholderiaceae bacterium]
MLSRCFARQAWSCYFALLLWAILGMLPGQAHAREAVTLQLKWLHQFQFAGYYAALEKGFFREEGLNVILAERDLTQNTVDQVLSGQAQYGVADSALFLHHANQAPIVLVAAIMQHSANAVMTRADSGIKTPRQLTGKRLAFYENDSDGIDILAMLAEQGVMKSGLTRMTWDERIAGLINGDIDAISIYVTNEPYVLREMGHEVNIINPRHYGLDLYGDMLFTSRREAADHPARVAAMRRAVIRGWDYALNNLEEMVELVYGKYNTQKKSRAALMHEALGISTLVSRHTIPLGEIDAGRVEYIQNRLKSLNLIAGATPNGNGFIHESSTRRNFELTPQEREFLANLGPIQTGIELQGWPPFEFFDDQGNFHGIAADYLELLSDRLGIEFAIRTDLPWSDLLQAARDKQIDLIPSAAATPDRREYLTFTRTYIRSPMVLVTRTDQDFIPDIGVLKGKAIGVVGGYASDEMLKRHYPLLTLKPYPSTRAGLKALAAGELFAFVDNLAAVTHLIKAEGLANLKISGQTPYSFDLAMGIRDDWPLLRSAIDKALASVEPLTHNDIQNRWVTLRVNEPFPWIKLLPVAAIAGFLFAALLAYLLHLRHLNKRIQTANQRLAAAEHELREKNRLLQELSITDKLTGTFNRHHLDTALHHHFQQAKRYQRPLSIVLIDLDHFKAVNDTYGHHTGDEILQRFAQTVAGRLRKTDIFGRWGGEEFLIICPETDRSGAVILADSIRQTVAGGMTLTKDLTQTISAGVAQAGEAGTIDELIMLADNRLYNAKQAGRNRVCAT